MSGNNTVIRDFLVRDMLKGALGENSALRLELSGRTPALVTRLRSLDVAAGHFEIEPFGVQVADRCLSSGIAVRGEMGVREYLCRFQTTCDGVAPEGGLWLRVPSEMELLPRRACRRIRPASTLRAAALYADRERLVELELLNISLGGVLVRDAKLAAPIRQDTPIVVQLTFDQKTAWRIPARVRHCADSPPGICLGLQFASLEPDDQAVLERILAQWEKASGEGDRPVRAE